MVKTRQTGCCQGVTSSVLGLVYRLTHWLTGWLATSANVHWDEAGRCVGVGLGFSGGSGAWNWWLLGLPNLLVDMVWAATCEKPHPISYPISYHVTMTDSEQVDR